ncbi:MAG: ABC transporter ATP-binding protein [Phycisphaerales bacterium]|nr:ABC transporter ATP-binding protein [Phycisphaerales bacterium]
MSDKPAVACEELWCTFAGGRQALAGVSFRLPAGGLTAIIGRSGCGKTTLLRIAAGLERPTRGRIRFVGADGSTQAMVRGAVALCFQEPRLLPWRKVVDNVALPLELAGVSRRERVARAEKVIHAAGLDGAQSRLPAQLSGGMRMRVALARALVTEPAVLLLDEPCSSVDEFTRMQLDEEILRVWQTSGATTLLVTHSVSEAVFLADTIVIMRRARVHSIHPVSLAQGSRDRTSREFSLEVEQVMRLLAHAAGVVLQ